MALGAALLAGAAVGAGHALESDHVAAVATLMDGERRVDDDTGGDRPALVGAAWGVGHTVPVAALGLAFAAAGLTLPDRLLSGVEGLVGVLLVALGVRMALRAVDVIGHVHEPAGGHAHLSVGGVALGGSHGHLADAAGPGAAAVGALHGVAGSGAIVVALAAEAPTLASAAVFLGGFGALSVATMAAVSLVWGRSLGTPLQGLLQAIAGIVGIVVGVSLLLEALGVGGLILGALGVGPVP